jgi:hypothetical protein
VSAQNGGVITLGNGAQFTTTGVQNTVGPIGSHALFATGTNSEIDGTGITIAPRVCWRAARVRKTVAPSR